MEEYFEKYKEYYFKLKKIAEKIWPFIQDILKEEKDILKISEKIEKKIEESGAKLAFPINIGINEIAAHFTPLPNEKIELKEGDLVKIDFGIQIDGYIFDNAKTFSIGKNEINQKLMKAAEKGLEEALKEIKSGKKVSEIGEIVERVAEEFELNPVRNLGGHSLGLYKIHAEPTILNSRNSNNFELVSGMPIAMEVFMTNGVGAVKESFPSRIFELEDYSKRNYLRNYNARKVVDFINENFKTLPFCKRWLIGKFPIFFVDYTLTRGVEIGIFHEYGVLKEISNGKVAQFETTIIVE